MPLEIDEIERGIRSGRTAPGLDAPGRGQPRTLGQLEIGGRADKQRLAGEFLQTDPFIFAGNSALRRRAGSRDAVCAITPSAAPMVDSCSAARRACEARPFRLIDQIERGDRDVRDQFAIEAPA